MVFKKQKISTSLSLLLIVAQMFFFGVASVFADTIDVGNVGSVGSVLKKNSVGGNGSSSTSSNDNSILGEVEQRYHINLEQVQSYGESMNVAQNKEGAPQVNLFFQPTNPKEGQAVTAQAFPMYFSNPKESMYFTWYLKRKGCSIATAKNNDPCDANDDGKVTVEDWKVTAMRSVVRSGYENGIISGKGKVTYNLSGNTDTDNDGYAARYGGDKSNTSRGGSSDGGSGFCYMHDFTGGEDYEIIQKDGTNGCQHLFPDAKVNGTTKTTGDGKFTEAEEWFWGTDPKDPSTAKNGNKDEANVVGLGQDRFTWNYVPGDEVGVAVEGLSMIPTKYDNASLMIMWAFPKNQCPSGDSIQTLVAKNSDTVDAKTVTVKGYDVKINTIQYDLNDCLEDNLIDPSQSVNEKLEVQLNTMPSSPIVHPIRGTMLTAQSTLSNAITKQSAIHYDWHVSINRRSSPTADAWSDITNLLATEKLITRTDGSGLNEVKVNLKFQSDDVLAKNNVPLCKDDSQCVLFDSTNKAGYFRLTLTATEQLDGGSQRVGRGSAIVKVSNLERQIDVRTIGVTQPTTGSGTLWLPEISSVGGSILCDNEDPNNRERIVCPVSRGQIVGLHFDPSKDLITDDKDKLTVSWTLNDKPLQCTPSVSKQQCDPDNTDYSKSSAYGLSNFFPVTGDVGDLYTIVMTAVNQTTGKSVTLKRVFQIVKPSIRIATTVDGTKTWPKYLGRVSDTGGQLIDDYSQEVFEAYAGKNIELQGLFSPGWLKDNANVAWSVDGTTVLGDANGMLSFPASTVIGSIMNITLQGEYAPSPEVRKALADIWGIVSPNETGETFLSDEVQVEMVGSAEENEGEIVFLKAKKFFASIISYVPNSVLFAFRLAATMIVILFVIGTVFSFIPETSPQVKRYF